MTLNDRDGIAIARLTEADFFECVDKRGLSPDWVEANCKSVSLKQASQLLGYPAKCDGIWIEGEGIQGQFKPSKPWVSKKDRDAGKEKPPKYRSPQDYSGEYDAILVKHPSDRAYWSDLNALKQRAYSIDGNPCLLITEGVFKAIAACSHDLPTIALLGVEMGLTSRKFDAEGRRYLVPSLKRFAEEGFGFCIIFDADAARNSNVVRAQRKLARQLELFDVKVYSATGLWSESEGKGLDDYIQSHGIKAFRFGILSKAMPHDEWEEKIAAAIQEAPDHPPEAEELYTQKAQAALYADAPWIAVEGELYKWVGTHYQRQGREAEMRRISQWCKSTPVEVSKGIWKYAFATSTHVTNIFNWVLTDVSVGRADINPPGINCLNGVLVISWKGAIAIWRLFPHSPERIYTYVNEIDFDPNIDPTDCDRLLSCLNADQQQVLLKTLAASIDLAKIREYRGRTASRALLLQGHGSNGKDSIREAVRLLFGSNMCSASVSDFAAYDSGRKFPLSKLEGCQISWSSENANFSNLDRLQSLKQAITGEPLDKELKGDNEQEMMLNCVFLFNINEAPNLKAGLEAIRSRWAVIRFDKTFKTNADPSKGEIEADSRFRYDPTFIKKKVAPALLNKMLNVLADLAVKGIDYACTESALEAIQQETNHLWIFAQEVGLSYKTDGRIYVKDLWERLRDWYIANGTLVITVDQAKGKEKTEWYDQARASDRNVKGANQVYQRFKELFPKMEKAVETIDQGRVGQTYLAGIAITASSASYDHVEQDTASLTASLTDLPHEAVTLDKGSHEAHEAVLGHLPHEPSLSVEDQVRMHPLGKWLIALPKEWKSNLPDGKQITLPVDYPGTRGRDQTKEPLHIRQSILFAQSEQDWKVLINIYGELAPRWVWLWMIPGKEKARLKPILKGEVKQLNLALDSPQSET